MLESITDLYNFNDQCYKDQRYTIQMMDSKQGMSLLGNIVACNLTKDGTDVSYSVQKLRLVIVLPS